jgi:PII-like signaling protein
MGPYLACRFVFALSIVIEIVDSAEKIQTLLPKFDEMIVEGLVTLAKVRVIAYRCEQDP